MYVGEFFLTNPFEENETTQLNLVRNYEWLDLNKLDGFTDEVRDILTKNKLLSDERITKILEQIKTRIDFIKDIIEIKDNENNF